MTPPDLDAEVIRLLPKMLVMARRFSKSCHPAIDVGDLEAAALEGLVQARWRYDAKRGVRFNTFAYRYAQGYILVSIREQKKQLTGRPTHSPSPDDAYPMPVSLSALIGLDTGESRDSMIPHTATLDGEPREDAIDALLIDWERQVEVERIWSLVAHLPAPQRRAIAYRYGEGLTHEQIAAREGVSHQSIRSRIRYALARLRRMLTDEEPGDAN